MKNATLIAMFISLLLWGIAGADVKTSVALAAGF